jgi:hypothetical protein
MIIQRKKRGLDDSNHFLESSHSLLQSLADLIFMDTVKRSHLHEFPIGI